MIRIPHHHVTVQRNGKNISPKIGEAFDFTADEVAELQGMHPNALRRPIVETVPARQTAANAAARRTATAPTEEVTSGDPVNLDDPAEDDAPAAAAARTAARKTGGARRPAPEASPAPPDAEDDEL